VSAGFVHLSVLTVALLWGSDFVAATKSSKNSAADATLSLRTGSIKADDNGVDFEIGLGGGSN
jgi:hypothetical protein